MSDSAPVPVFTIGSTNGELPATLDKIRAQLLSEALIENPSWATPANLRSAAHRSRMYLKQNFPEVNYAVGEQSNPPRLHVYVKAESALPQPSANAPSPQAADPRTAPELLAAEWMYAHYSERTTLGVRLAMRSNRETFVQLANAGVLSTKFIAEGRELLTRIELSEQRKRELEQPKKIWEIVLEKCEKGEVLPPADVFALARVEKLIPESFRAKLREYEVLP